MFSRSIRRYTLALPLFLPLTMLGCAGYDITLNNQVIYQPAALYTAFEVEDSALLNCLQQTIEDQSITDPAQLHQLICSNSGISSLVGLATFSELESLKLSHNKIRSVQGINDNLRLKHLIMDNNSLTDLAALFTLDNLKEVDISGNSTLNCADILRLQQQNKELHIANPDHCD